MIKRAVQLCNRGDLVPLWEHVVSPRLRRIISERDVLEIRHIVPALVELIERRGLK